MNKALIFLVLAAVFAVASAGYLRYAGYGGHGYGHGHGYGGYRVAYRPAVAYYRPAYYGGHGLGHGYGGYRGSYYG